MEYFMNRIEASHVIYTYMYIHAVHVRNIILYKHMIRLVFFATHEAVLRAPSGDNSAQASHEMVELVNAIHTMRKYLRY